MKVPFYKCNSKGNSFIILSGHINDRRFTSQREPPPYSIPNKTVFIDDFSTAFKVDFWLSGQEININKLSEICNSIDNKGIDGFILLSVMDYEMCSGSSSIHYFNNDGSWETFCLNGTICCSLILNELRSFSGFLLSVDYSASKISVEVLENNVVQVELPNPINMEFDELKGWQKGSDKFYSILIDGLKCYYIHSGAKHIIIKSEDDKLFKNDLNLEKILKKIRYNKLFLPHGVNVNIYRCKGSSTIQVKTYEKGIESMMPSCSSGSYASAYHYYNCYERSSRIKILNDGGTSEIIFKANGKNLFLSKGEIEYKGELEI